MDLSFRFDWWFDKLPASPTDAGRVDGCVVRTAAGERSVRAAIDVTPQGGVEDDRWAQDPQRSTESQISLINVHVLRSLCESDDARMPLSGDNLHVDLDLSETNLPAGTRLAIGTAVLEITPQPHRPCRLFHERYGASAVKKVARANRVGRRGRGVLARIIVAGNIRVGDAIHVLRADARQDA